MSRYLLAAETDKNQDFIFRSARLTQVAGASLLLSRFCRDGVLKLLELGQFGAEGQDWGILVNDGGSFRIWFGEDAKARRFAGQLSELYFRTSGASLTTANEFPEYQPNETNPGDAKSFSSANQKASDALQKAKHSGRRPRGVAHLPQMAFCVACGVEPAQDYAPFKDAQVYLCGSCQAKLAEWRGFSGKRNTGENRSDFLTDVRDSAWKLHASLAGEVISFPLEPAEALGGLDRNNYVAYLLADGNGMGRWFGSCQSEDELIKLSKGLSEALRCALTEPLLDLYKVIQSGRDGRALGWMPISPLILGGDDLFAILPAPWGLDYARRVCQAFEGQMKTVLRADDGWPTLSAALVICKANYPYRLAHKLGEALLKDAKRLARYGMGNGTRSVVNFQVVQGSDTPLAVSLLPTLRPYWAVKGSDERALCIKELLDLRAELEKKEVPSGRLQALRERFLPSALPQKGITEKEWAAETSALVQRISRFNLTHAEAITSALIALGSQDEKTDLGRRYWKRPQLVEKPVDANGVPDLLEVWDFANTLSGPAQASADHQGGH